MVLDITFDKKAGSQIFSVFPFIFFGSQSRLSLSSSEHCLGKAFILAPSWAGPGVWLFLCTVFSHSRPHFRKVHQKIWSKRLPQDRPLCWSSEAQQRMKCWSVTRLMNTKEHFCLVSHQFFVSVAVSVHRLEI